MFNFQLSKNYTILKKKTCASALTIFLNKHPDEEDHHTQKMEQAVKDATQP